MGAGDQNYRSLSTEPMSFLLPGWRGQSQFHTPHLVGRPGIWVVKFPPQILQATLQFVLDKYLQRIK